MQVDDTGWPRGIRCLIFIGLFQQKNPVINGSFAERDLKLKASCATARHCIKGHCVMECTLFRAATLSRQSKRTCLPTEAHVHGDMWVVCARIIMKGGGH